MDNQEKMTKYNKRLDELYQEQAENSHHGDLNILYMVLNFVFLITGQILCHLAKVYGGALLTSLLLANMAAQLTVLILIIANVVWLIKFCRRTEKSAEEFDKEMEEG